MATHKFAVGQTVRFLPHPHEDSSEGGAYTIVRLLPEQDKSPHYRMKAEIGGRERVAPEGQLKRS